MVVTATRILPTSGNKPSTLLIEQEELKIRNDLDVPDAEVRDDIKRISVGAERTVMVKKEDSDGLLCTR